MSERPLNALFLCTHNSARSIIAEAIMNRLGAGRFKAYSAGSQPSGQINPHALTMLKSLATTFRVFGRNPGAIAELGAPVFDFIFTVCDDAAGETAVWPGQPMARGILTRRA